jgi:predicted Zn finger-like uncharacterized protein
MILTCPSCATRYIADEAILGGKGKLVRCATCRHTWRARASDMSEGVEEEASLAAALDAHEDDVLSEHDISFPERPLAPGAPNMRAAILGWTGAGVGLLLLMTLAVLFRVEIVSLWPKTASVYAAAGFTVTAEGLVFESVAAAPGYHEGEPTLTITAAVRNTSGRVREVPPVWIGLFDEDGEEVFSWAVALEVAELAPRQSARFTALLAQPPVDAQDLELRFARGAEGENPVPAATELVGGASEAPEAAEPAPEPESARDEHAETAEAETERH